ncbi:hypothetical protein C7S14_8378 [Burkholderia cepacia]|nr:hypothetical protein C7S14_8378 [Burkholderia cepacia]
MLYVGVLAFLQAGPVTSSIFNSMKKICFSIPIWRFGFQGCRLDCRWSD